MPLTIHSKEFYSNYIFHPLSDELSTEDKTKALTVSVFAFILSLGIFPLCCYIKYKSKKYTINSEQTVDQKIKRTTGSSFQPENVPIQQPTSHDRFPNALTEEEIYKEIEKFTGIDFKTHMVYRMDFAEMSKKYLEKYPNLGKPGELVRIPRPAQQGDNFNLRDAQVAALCIYLVLTDKVESYILDRASHQLGSVKDYRTQFPKANVDECYTKIDGKLVMKQSLKDIE